MNKKLLTIMVVILAVLVAGAYQFVYVPYQNEQAIKEYNAGLVNASAIEDDINTTFAQFDNIDQSNFTAYTNNLTEKYNNEIVPKIDNEISKLNETKVFANGNKTREDYVDFQIERLQLEKDGIQLIIDKMNELKNAIEKNDYNNALKIASDMENEINNVSKKLEPVRDNIYDLLKTDTSFNESLHNLTLSDEFYGDINTTRVSI